MHNAKCAAMHLDVWSVKADWLHQTVDLIKSGIIPADADRANRSYSVDDNSYEVADGIAIISMAGSLMKQWSKYGGTSTTWLRAAIRHADRNSAVKGIMLHIDSPGGTSAGTAELGDEVRRTSKPIYAHIDDLGASAAYWVASQADSISINRAGFSGSIGTYAVIYDTSKQAEMEGIKVHVLSTGAFKGSGEPGTEITEEQLGEWQSVVDSHFEHFAAAVRSGRPALKAKAHFNAVADGRVFDAKSSLQNGLVDRVESFGTALIRLRKSV